MSIKHCCHSELHCTNFHPPSLPVDASECPFFRFHSPHHFCTPCILLHACDIDPLPPCLMMLWQRSIDDSVVVIQHTQRCKSSAHAHCVATSSAEVCLQHFNCLLMMINYCFMEILSLLLLLLLLLLLKPHLFVVVVIFPPVDILILLLCFGFLRVR